MTNATDRLSRSQRHPARLRVTGTQLSSPSAGFNAVKDSLVRVPTRYCRRLLHFRRNVCGPVKRAAYRDAAGRIQAITSRGTLYVGPPGTAFRVSA